MSYLLALDAGTGSIRAVIFDLNGRQLAVGQAEWKHLSVDNVPGSMEFDLTTNWQLACQCIRQALDAARLSAADIQSVACCSMREGIVLYDRNGEAIWACANVDARASREVAELKEIHDYRFESEVYEVSGQTLALSAMPRLLWLAHHRPDIYRKAATITMISDWLAAKLSGELAVDPSNAGTTGMLDLFSRDWRPALLDMAGLRADMLSPVKETGTLLGAVTEAAAQQSGLRAGTPVVMGGGDVQLGCLGLGVVRAGQTAVLGGTFWQQVVNLPQVRTDPQMNIRVNPHVIPGMAQAESISFFTGLTMRWFRDAFCAEEKLIAERLGREPLHCGDSGPELISSVAWCTGGGQSYINQAAEQGIDAFISGEASEQTIHTAREMGMHFYAAGHHATERYGVKALGEWLATVHGLDVTFIDIDNPV